MKLFITLLTLQTFNCFAQVTQQWASRYNGPAGFDDFAYSLAVDTSGNVYITGWSYGIGSNDDATTIKYNSSGVQQWAQRYNGPYSGADQLYSLVLDNSSNVYVAGYSTRSSTLNRYLIIKYNSSGVQQWMSAADTGKAWSIVKDTAGFLYVTGTSTSSSPYVTKKYDQAGNILWTRIYAYGRNTEYPHLASDLSGNIYLGGTASPGYDYCIIKYNSNGDSLWIKKYNSPFNYEEFLYAITTDNSGNVFATGTSWGGTSTYYDMLTVKYNSAGVFQWAVRYDDPIFEHEYGRSVAADQSGNVYITGWTQNNMSLGGDMITIKYNSAGAQLWVARYNGTASGLEYSWSIALDNIGNSYITGASPANFSSSNVITIKYNSAGAQQWVATYNGPANNTDGGRFIALDAGANVYVTGNSMGSSSQTDMITIKYSQVVGIKPISNEVPNHFSLSQNYPNPFNPNTIIRFNIPLLRGVDAEGRRGVLLVIHDILGKEVAILVNEELKPGTYEVDWNASNYPSGVYYYKLTSGDYIETKKMILIR